MVAAVAAVGLFTQTVVPIGLRGAGWRPSRGAARRPSQPRRQPATPAATATPAAAPAPIDGGWPRIYDLPSGGTMLVYQPQVASWDKQKHLVAFSAVSYRPKAGDKPAVGTIKLEADTERLDRPSASSASRR